MKNYNNATMELLILKLQSNNTNKNLLWEKQWKISGLQTRIIINLNAMAYDYKLNIIVNNMFINLIDNLFTFRWTKINSFVIW